MKLFEKIKALTVKYFLNPKWRCLSCGKEVFNEEAFCKDCKKQIEFTKDYICFHCGRLTKTPEKYCSTCKNQIVDLDKGRSVFDYSGVIPSLIKKFKYDKKKYLGKIFAEYLLKVYNKEFIDDNINVITFVPNSKNELKGRGYNQSKFLATEFCKLGGFTLKEVLSKRKETLHQVGLKREERVKNLLGAFKVTDKKEVEGKNVLIIDDVTTTGSTVQVLAQKLKKAKASRVFLLTIASVSRIKEEI